MTKTYEVACGSAFATYSSPVRERDAVAISWMMEAHFNGHVFGDRCLEHWVKEEKKLYPGLIGTILNLHYDFSTDSADGAIDIGDTYCCKVADLDEDLVVSKTVQMSRGMFYEHWFDVT